MVNSVVDTRTSTSDVRGQRIRREAATSERLFLTNASPPEPNVLYEGEPSSLLEVCHVFLVGGVYITSPSESGPELMSSFPLFTTRWPEPEPSPFGSIWSNPREMFQAGPETTVALPLGTMSYESIPIGGRSPGYNANQALTNLQTINPGAVERIRKLTKLEPGWDGYGGGPPTEEAIKTTTFLLLMIHGLTHGSLESPFIAPSPDGGLDLEWELKSGAELLLVIPPTGTDIRYLLDEPTSSGDIVELAGVLPKDATLSELLSRLTR